jgi:thiol-disulfide isomerase/thioredoxin
MRLLSIILTICIFLCRCDQNKKSEIENKDFFKSGTVTISGQITNLSTDDSRYIFLQKEDLLSGKSEVISIKINSSGYFEKILPVFNPQEITLDFQNRRERLLVKQSDSLHLVINARNPEQEVIFSGSAGIRNTLWNEYTKTFSKISTQISGKELDFIIGTSNKIKFQLDSLNKLFIAQKKPDELLLNWIYAEKKSIYYLNIFDFALTKFVRPSTILREEKIISEKDINNSDFYCNNHYASGIFNIYGSSLLNENQTLLKGLIDKLKNNNYNEAITLLADSIYRDFVGISKDVILYQSFNMFSQQEFIDMLGKSPNFELLKKYYLQHVQNEFVKSQLLNSASESENNNNEGRGDNDSPDILSELISKHKGKILYIDISATWCGPCIMELPNSITLHENLNNKNVVFVYLYANSRKSDWEKISKNNVLKDENILLSDEQYKLLVSKYKVESSFPQYLLIDKSGGITKNAKRPSDQGLKIDIFKLLDQ